MWIISVRTELCKKQVLQYHFVKEGTLRKRFEVKGELFDYNVYSFVGDDLEE